MFCEASTIVYMGLFCEAETIDWEMTTPCEVDNKNMQWQLSLLYFQLSTTTTTLLFGQRHKLNFENMVHEMWNHLYVMNTEFV